MPNYTFYLETIWFTNGSLYLDVVRTPLVVKLLIITYATFSLQTVHLSWLAILTFFQWTCF